MPDISIPDTLNTAKDDAVKYVQNLDVQGFGRGNEEETLPRRMSQYSANVDGDREWYADERPLPESTARQIFAQYKRHKRKATIKRLKTERMNSLLVEEADANEVDPDVRIRQVSKNRFNVEELSQGGGS